MLRIVFLYNRYKSTIMHFKRNLLELKDARDANDKLLLERIEMFIEIAGCYVMRNVSLHIV